MEPPGSTRCGVWRALQPPPIASWITRSDGRQQAALASNLNGPAFVEPVVFSGCGGPRRPVVAGFGGTAPGSGGWGADLGGEGHGKSRGTTPCAAENE
jgi:hypothetical protein